LSTESQEVREKPYGIRQDADVEAGRTRIAHEREKSHTIAGQIEADLEAYLLARKRWGQCRKNRCVQPFHQREMRCR
jgi:hypothetical protein